MTYLNFPDKKITIKDFSEIKDFFNKKGVFIDKWETTVSFSKDADQGTILKAYDSCLKPFMAKWGYIKADVISVHSEIPGIYELKQKFIKEHTHTDDEVRFLVDGQGIFWFNLGNDEPIFCLHCTSGVIISVPANTKHWFDMGEKPFVKAIRIFKDEKGWEANYTNSRINEKYSPIK